MHTQALLILLCRDLLLGFSCITDASARRPSDNTDLCGHTIIFITHSAGFCKWVIIKEETAEIKSSWLLFADLSVHRLSGTNTHTYTQDNKRSDRLKQVSWQSWRALLLAVTLRCCIVLKALSQLIQSRINVIGISRCAGVKHHQRDQIPKTARCCVQLKTVQLLTSAN